MSNEEVGSFDPAAFLDATTTEALVRRPPLPVGDYVGTVGEPKSREAVEIGSLEGQLPDLGKIKLCRRADDAIGPAEAVRDRRAHIGRAQLRHHRPIGKLDHAVDDRLRVHQNVDLLRRQRKQV